MSVSNLYLSSQKEVDDMMAEIGARLRWATAEQVRAEWRGDHGRLALMKAEIGRLWRLWNIARASWQAIHNQPGAMPMIRGMARPGRGSPAA
ncbi:MAG: hypothetical protein ACKVYV_14270 [Limisphaerales bacterium]